MSVWRVREPPSLAHSIDAHVPAAFHEADLNATLKSFFHGCLSQENEVDEQEGSQWGDCGGIE